MAPPNMPPPPGMGRGRPPGPRSFLTAEEKAAKPKVTYALIKRICSYLKPYLPQFILVLASLAVSAVLGLFPSVLTGKIVDEIISSDRSLHRLAVLLIIAFAVLAASQIISVLEQYISAWISQKIIYDMRNQMYSHLSGMSHSFFTSEKQGDILTHMNSDINGVGMVISGTLSSIVSNTLTAITCIICLFYTDWRLAVVGLALLPIMIFPTRAVGRKRWELAAKAQENQDELNQQVDETLSVSGSMLVKLFTRESREFEKFRSVNKRLTDTTVKEQRAGSWFHVMLGMFIQTVPLLIYFAGGFLMLSGNGGALTVGGISVVVSLVNRLYQPVRQLLNIQVDFIRSLALFTRIFDYFDRPCEIVNPPSPKKPDMSDCSICFSDVHFSYGRGGEVLKGVNFILPNGKMYALVGSSGAGKSTVIHMITRLYDATQGSVNVAGKDVREFDLDYLRSKIGVVSQDTYLFNGTIRENLLYACENADEAMLDDACRAANIYDFINRLPDKYDTLVGNRGLKLSGGEKQRISIARVILKNPQILILDEATSSLDSVSESQIQSALERLMLGRTSLVIAHRLSTVLAADKIMVLENGVISESGTHDELLKTSSCYKLLYDTQFKRVIEHEREKISTFSD